MSDETLSLRGIEPLNDADTVGVVSDIEPAETTVTFHDVGRAVTRHFGQHAVADDDSRVFIGSDGGDLTTSLGPLFDAPVSSNFELGLARTAIGAIQGDGGPEYRPQYVDFDVVFDDAGPVVFRSRETGRLAAVCPIELFNQKEPSRPTGPPTGPIGPTTHSSEEVGDDE